MFSGASVFILVVLSFWVEEILLRTCVQLAILSAQVLIFVATVRLVALMFLLKTVIVG